MKSIIVIPARYQSKRFPGKPLAMISGKSMLQRVWSIAKAVKHIDDVLIATDDPRIEKHALSFGANVVMTSEQCENGTVRIHEAITHANLNPDIVINLQGDAVLTPPWVIQSLLDSMLKNPNDGLTTLATKMSKEQYALMVNTKNKGAVGGTTVVFDLNHYALYFSKALIPYMRNTPTDAVAYRHIGLYGYRFPTLKKYLSLAPTPLEITEELEQLRALENGIPIRVVIVDYKGRSHWAVDCPDDVAIVETIIAKEGEL